MGNRSFPLLSLFVLVSTLPSVTVGEALSPIFDVASLNRTSFPAPFIFGAGSASYQYEGGANEDGKGPSIWDTFTHKYPDKILDRSNGDVAVDQYHRYKEDVGIMKYMNLDAYRFSISWSRILPKGKLNGGINQEGVKYYNNLINELIAKGIQPFVTLFHWDLPQALEDEYGGFLNPQILKDFQDYAELCFKEFGDRVKHWVTLNQPYTYSTGGYATGVKAPGRCSKWLNPKCIGGDSGTEPYIISHHLLLAHATTVQVYKKKYQVYGATNNRKLSQKHVFTAQRHGIPIGSNAASSWLYVYPKGIRHLLLYVKKKYNNPLIYITENGIDEFNDPMLSIEEALLDTYRIDYYYRHLFYLQSAIKDGANYVSE
ncbi:hypothetical protein CR513_20548, partial [Mucuna pruriens]